MKNTVDRNLGGFGIPYYLRPVNSVFVAVLDLCGNLVDANSGVIRLAGEGTTAYEDLMEKILVSPSVSDTIKAGRQIAEHESFSGFFSVKDADGASDVLFGRVFRIAQCVLIVCEPMIAGRSEYSDDELDLHTNTKMTGYVDTVARLANTDELTGLSNRRHFDYLLAHQLRYAERSLDPLAIVFVDVDRFKQFNDRFGHVKGDLLLRQLAVELQKQKRFTDVVARWGGDEFVVLAPATSREGAMLLARRIIRLLAGSKTGDAWPTVSVSIGIAERKGGDSAESLLGRADEALYRAKASGRGRIVAAS